MTTMKLILTQEVTGLGSSGDTVEVKGGYGRNYLLPQGFAIGWTKGAEKQVTSIKRARSAREIRDLGHATEVKVRGFVTWAYNCPEALAIANPRATRVNIAPDATGATTTSGERQPSDSAIS